MDDTDGFDFSLTWTPYYVHPECGSSTVYLYPVLNMIKIFKIINRFIRAGINILIKLILGVVYFILLLPFAFFVKLCTDFLGIRNKSSTWIPCNKILNVEKFLHQQ